MPRLYTQLYDAASKRLLGILHLEVGEGSRSSVQSALVAFFERTALEPEGTVARQLDKADNLSELSHLSFGRDATISLSVFRRPTLPGKTVSAQAADNSELLRYRRLLISIRPELERMGMNVGTNPSVDQYVSGLRAVGAGLLQRDEWLRAACLALTSAGYLTPQPSAILASLETLTSDLRDLKAEYETAHEDLEQYKNLYRDTSGSLRTLKANLNRLEEENAALRQQLEQSEEPQHMGPLVSSARNGQNTSNGNLRPARDGIGAPNSLDSKQSRI